MFTLEEQLQKKIDENLRTDLQIHTSSLTMISVSLVCCCEKIFTHMNTWVIGKKLIKHCYNKKKIFSVT